MWKIIATCGVVIMLMMSASGVTLTLNALVWAKVYQLMTEVEDNYHANDTVEP